MQPIPNYFMCDSNFSLFWNSNPWFIVVVFCFVKGQFVTQKILRFYCTQKHIWKTHEQAYPFHCKCLKYDGYHCNNM